MNTRWLLLTIFLAGALTFFNWYGLSQDLFGTVWWYDIPMHMLGGATISAFILGLFGAKRPGIFWGALAAISLGWEIFEWIVKLVAEEQHYILDTLHDFLNNAIGGGIMWRLRNLWR